MSGATACDVELLGLPEGDHACKDQAYLRDLVNGAWWGNLGDAGIQQDDFPLEEDPLKQCLFHEGRVTLRFCTPAAAALALNLRGIVYNGVELQFRQAAGVQVKPPKKAEEIQVEDLRSILGFLPTEAFAMPQSFVETIWTGNVFSEVLDSWVKLAPQSHYDLLSVDRCASRDEILAGFRRQCRASSQSDAGKLTAACRTLTTPQKKHPYDHQPEQFVWDAVRAAKHGIFQPAVFVLRHLDQLRKGHVRRIEVPPRHSPTLRMHKKVIVARSRGADLCVVSALERRFVPSEVWVVGDSVQRRDVEHLVRRAGEEADGVHATSIFPQPATPLFHPSAVPTMPQPTPTVPPKKPPGPPPAPQRVPVNLKPAPHVAQAPEEGLKRKAASVPAPSAPPPKQKPAPSVPAPVPKPAAPDNEAEKAYQNALRLAEMAKVPESLRSRENLQPPKNCGPFPLLVRVTGEDYEEGQPGITSMLAGLYCIAKHEPGGGGLPVFVKTLPKRTQEQRAVKIYHQDRQWWMGETVGANEIWAHAGHGPDGWPPKRGWIWEEQELPRLQIEAIRLSEDGKEVEAPRKVPGDAPRKEQRSAQRSGQRSDQPSEQPANAASRSGGTPKVGQQNANNIHKRLWTETETIDDSDSTSKKPATSSKRMFKEWLDGFDNQRGGYTERHLDKLEEHFDSFDTLKGICNIDGDSNLEVKNVESEFWQIMGITRMGEKLTWTRQLRNLLKNS